MAWARPYLKKYGFITDSARGVWALTPKGSDLKSVDPRVVVRMVQEQSSRERQGQTDSEDAEERRTEPETGEEETAFWGEKLLTTLLEMLRCPSMLSSVCIHACCETRLQPGFIQVEVTGRSGDGGVDGHSVMRLGRAVQLSDDISVQTLPEHHLFRRREGFS